MTIPVFWALLPAVLLLISGGSAAWPQTVDVPTSARGRVQWQYDAGG
jgi:hypothetical protein